jgi:hypothetical protein
VGSEVISLSFQDPLADILTDLRNEFSELGDTAITRKLVQPLPTKLVVVGGAWGRRAQTVFKLYRLRVRIWCLDSAGDEDWDALSDLSSRVAAHLEMLPRRLAAVTSTGDVNGPYPVEDKTGPELRLLTIDYLIRGVE